MIFYIYQITLNEKAENIKLIPSDDLVILKWFDMSDLQNIDLTPPSVELFKRLGLIK